MKTIEQDNVQIPLARLYLFAFELATPPESQPIVGSQIRWLALVEQQLSALVVVEIVKL